MKKIMVALLDDNRRLVGYDYKQDVRADDVRLDEGCDLPTDGTYKWDGTKFVPLGHGHGPVASKPPVTETRVLYLLIQALGKEAPPECREWAKWYEQNLKRREEELATRHRIRQRRGK